MNWRRSLVVLLTLATNAIFSQCSTEYERMLKSEAEKGVRNDSIFMGLYLGMPKKDFFGRCWELNKQGVLRQGPGNLSVQHRLDSSVLGAPAFMRFYPVFKDGKILAMPVEFSFEAWAPWNKDLYSDKLLEQVKKLAEQWYGEGFLKLEHEKKGLVVFVKVDGNREVRLYQKDDARVKMEIINLLESEGDTKL